MSKILRSVKNVVGKYSVPEIKARECTSNDPWFPSTSQLEELARFTFHEKSKTDILGILFKRLTDHNKNYMHILKSMIALEYLSFFGHGSIYIVFSNNRNLVTSLTTFMYIDKDGRDKGHLVRQRAHRVKRLIEDKEFYQSEQALASKAKNRISSENMGGTTHESPNPGYTARSEKNAVDYMPRNQEEEDMQLQIALALSKQEAESFNFGQRPRSSIENHNRDEFDVFSQNKNEEASPNGNLAPATNQRSTQRPNSVGQVKSNTTTQSDIESLFTVDVNKVNSNNDIFSNNYQTNAGNNSRSTNDVFSTNNYNNELDVFNYNSNAGFSGNNSNNFPSGQQNASSDLYFNSGNQFNQYGANPNNYQQNSYYSMNFNNMNDLNTQRQNNMNNPISSAYNQNFNASNFNTMGSSNNANFNNMNTFNAQNSNSMNNFNPQQTNNMNYYNAQQTNSMLSFNPQLNNNINYQNSNSTVHMNNTGNTPVSHFENPFGSSSGSSMIGTSRQSNHITLSKQDSKTDAFQFVNQNPNLVNLDFNVFSSPKNSEKLPTLHEMQAKSNQNRANEGGVTQPQNVNQSNSVSTDPFASFDQNYKSTGNNQGGSSRFSNNPDNPFF